MSEVAVVCVPFRLLGDSLAVWLAGEEGGARSLPKAVVADSESHQACLSKLVAALPFAREVVRRAECGVRSDPSRTAGTREIALVAWVTIRPPAGRTAEDGASERGAWCPVDRLPVMVDDHAETVQFALNGMAREILGDPITRRVLPRHLLRARTDALLPVAEAVEREPALFGLLPDPFPLSAIRRFYERLLESPIDRGNFRRKLGELRPSGVIKELPIFQRGVRHRAAQLFTFDSRAWERWIAGSLESAGKSEVKAD